ncbi:hypothetical protein [Desulfovibrio ferrophilus]|uniref:Uncharacterized protein n=1 Tax=Desulfovibrio ferrophilus TaxID=241368 RepID=A0A2Z6B372_9BACT|nr:hypothetical protein [Desulfovibrio ferrophilus]BBD09984.1 hypothetical protein DFE_3258 [Desulfovibrio ferrophilus]
MGNSVYILYSGGANGAEAEFGALAERYGLEEVNYSFEGHQTGRERGARVLTTEELTLKDVSLTYVSRLMNRKFSSAPIFRKVLQSICWQVASGHEVYVVGAIQEDGTVKGGTGWGAEYAKICNKPLFVFDQEKKSWFQWLKGSWEVVEAPVISHHHFTGTGTRFMNDDGRKALTELFERSFGK